MWLNWHAFFLNYSMHGTTSSHQPETEIEAMAEQIGCCVKGEKDGEREGKEKEEEEEGAVMT